MKLSWLAVAVALLGVLLLLRAIRVWYVPLYVALGIGIWFATLESGIHATIAGVTLGLLAPARPLIGREAAEALLHEATEPPRNEEVRENIFLMRESVPVVERLQRELHPWSSYMVIPIFALANAGVSLTGQAAGEALGSRVTLGVLLGLVLGKPLGIFAASWLVTRIGLASKPEEVTWRQLTGIGMVAGIGFTMSLFVAGLAFAEGPQFEEAKMGILAASVIAGLAGWLVLRRV